MRASPAALSPQRLRDRLVEEIPLLAGGRCGVRSSSEINSASVGTDVEGGPGRLLAGRRCKRRHGVEAASRTHRNGANEIGGAVDAGGTGGGAGLTGGAGAGGVGAGGVGGRVRRRRDRCAANGGGIGGVIENGAAGATAGGVPAGRLTAHRTGGGTIEKGNGADGDVVRTAWYCARKFSSATGAAT